MRKLWSWGTVGVFGLVLCANTLSAAEDEREIDIPREGEQVAPIPVSLEGFTGEVLNVLNFDLYVAGFRVVPSGAAQYQLSGNNSASLVGRVKDRISGATLLSREYTGGTARVQAHSFADEFVGLFPGRMGIARCRIAFRIESGGGGNSEIYVADYDGFNATAVTADKSIGRDPAWIPGKHALLYTSYRKGSPFIYLHDLSSGARQVLAGFPGLNALPAASPDGRRVAMILSKSGSPDLYVASLDGTGLRRLTTTKEDESSPCWSPDGRTICFSSRAHGRAALYLISPEGGTMRRLSTPGSGAATEPSWSPDGKTIAFTASVGGFTVCTVPASGGAVTRLVAGEDPSWAPNSRTILFTRRLGGGRVLSLLDVPTKQVKDVRRFSGSSSQPDWAR